MMIEAETIESILVQVTKFRESKKIVTSIKRVIEASEKKVMIIYCYKKSNGVFLFFYLKYTILLSVISQFIRNKLFFSNIAFLLAVYFGL